MKQKNEEGLDNGAYEKDTTDLEHGNEKLSPSKEVEAPKRDNWGGDLEFLMSCIAMSVGLGNLWRFPFIANEHGGGAFLIPYVIVLNVVGRPLYFMEMSLGQFTSRANIHMFGKLSPVFRGIGYGQLIGLICVTSYFASIMAITLFYFFNSFTSNFPWAKCRPEWFPYIVSKGWECVDHFSNVTEFRRDTISSSELYFKLEVLKERDDITDGIGTPDWRLTLLLLAAWAITCMVTIKGIKTSGKISYFLAIFPYAILISLLIKTATLDGASNGMYYFIETDWNRIKDADVWFAAVTQCFISLNVGFGELIMFSSYNNFKRGIRRDVWIVSTLDTITALLAGLTIFGILGNLAYEMDVHPSEVIAGGGGTGLAFISYPDVIAKFDVVPWLFGILFFFMLFTLGVGSQAASHEAINTIIKDSFPGISSWKTAVGTATALFLMGLIYKTPGGQHVLELVDHFGGTVIVLPFVILEVVVVVWVYGLEQFCLDVEFMTKKKVGFYWRVCWGLVMPVMLIAILVYFLATVEPLIYGYYELHYPTGLTVFGWAIVAIGVVQMLCWVSYYLYANREYPVKKMIQKTFSTETWAPIDPKMEEEWRRFKEEYMRNKPTGGFWLVRKLKILVSK